ncbi:MULTISPECIES: restriction endonuclease [unclassified Burkholderia]|uniref:restriction endonuclease n=1 Tax=unclassified Burkholderia TaxID=2613784 RepID=UPI0009EA6392|nr:MULTISPECIES: restriction endonuclease [unclassified Burkholderia]
MNGPWQHSPGQYFPFFKSLDLPTCPEGSGPPEEVRCVYCKILMDEFCNVDLWNKSFQDFKEAYVPTMKAFIRDRIAPSKLHVRLSGDVLAQRSTLYICPTCGWWVAMEQAVLPALQWQHWCLTLYSMAVIKDLELSCIDTPITQVRNYLMRRFESRGTLHPRLFEETVASVFRDHGYDTTLTTYSRDGGIDIILLENDGKKIGVQVKRLSRSIEVEQIRSFLGALMLGGYARGIFVSSTKFQQGAVDAARASTEQYIPIELVDSASFFDMLGIAQLNKRPDPSLCGIEKSSPLSFDIYSLYHLNTL